MDIERIEVRPDDRIGLMARLLVECTHCGLSLAAHDWLDVATVQRFARQPTKGGMRLIECCSECREDHRLY